MTRFSCLTGAVSSNVVKINELAIFFNDLPNDADFFMIQAKYQRLSGIVAAFEELERDVIEFNSNAKKEDKFVKINPKEFYDACDFITSTFLRLKQAFELQERPPNNNVCLPQTQNVNKQSINFAKLKIHIPVFCGKIHEWNNFFSLFESLVNKNQNLSNIEKLQLLKCHVAGDALKIVETYDLIAENFLPAYTSLKERYANPRILANVHLNNLFSFQPIGSNNYGNLQKYFSVHSDSIKSFKRLDIPDPYDYILFQLCYTHLDKKSQQEFDKLHPASGFPTYEQLMSFVSAELRNQELHSKDISCNEKSDAPKPKIRNVHHNEVINENSSSRKASCIMCSDSHMLFSCPKFIAMSVSERYSFVKSKRACFNCLSVNHSRQLCTSDKRCRTCNRFHNSLLHLDNVSSNSVQNVQNVQNMQTVPSTSAPQEEVTSNHVQAAKPEGARAVLLGTAKGFIVSPQGKMLEVRLLMDSGSQISILSERIAKLLNLTMLPCSDRIRGISSASAPCQGKVSVKLMASPHSSVSYQLDAFVLKKVTSDLPTTNVPDSACKMFQKYKLADVGFQRNGPIDVLIGADLYYDLLLDTPMVRGTPNGIHTVFGLMLSGNLPSSQVSATHVSNVASLESIMDKFWHSEEIPDLGKLESPEDIRCDEIFNATTTRDSTGRYVVNLPFCADPGTICNNREVAHKRLAQVERRLNANPQLREDYNKFMSEYLNLGHMSPTSKLSPYLIPHHPVFKESTTTKVRVVFDASNGSPSLNDVLMKGKKMSHDIFNVLSGFRLYKVALCADLKMMYRQIILNEEHRKYVHIIYRFSLDEPVQEFCLNTVTYGLKPSSFLSQNVLCKLNEDEGHDFPLASLVLTNQVFVDDICAGADSDAQAIQLYKELLALLGRGGFFPRKWTSSSQAVLDVIPTEHRETPLSVDEDGATYLKVLGVQWECKSDSFNYVTREFTGPITKRNVLSYIARMYDPTGFCSPYVFKCKVFMKKLWQCGMSWDQEISNSLKDEWLTIISNVKVLSDIRIPRHIPIASSTSFQILGYCDASESGYASAIYVKCFSDGQAKTYLLAAKSKVSPMKPLSIPRLELNAAYLLSKMFKSYKEFIDRLSCENIFCFSDSQVVLSWINTAPHKLKTYVANRVVAITEQIPQHSWFHVRSQDNPADCASRGLTPDELVKNAMWWECGNQEMFYPPSNPICDFDSQDYANEVKPAAVYVSNVDNMNSFIDRFSDLNVLQRVAAQAIRFCKMFCQKYGKGSFQVPQGPISVKELKEALLFIVRLVQREYYAKEIALIEKTQYVHSLRQLSPFLDATGCLRVGGRLANSTLPYHAKYPLLLPPKGHFTKLVIDCYHRITLHGGPQVTRSCIQTMFWIPKIGHVIKSAIFSCVRCQRFSGKVIQPPMADLPASRFSEVRAFLRCGVDFCGPFLMCETTRRKSIRHKTYVCVFVCFSTKAVHLEFVSDLSANAFMLALDRFVARRGKCAYIHSDCGSNFIAGSRMLKEVKEFYAASNDQIQAHLANQQIEWIFNPPSAPNFGGLWEAAVKSFKHHLYRTMLNHVLTFEEFNTLICRIEAILNSRPMCAINNVPDDNHMFLTPGHFLIGGPLLAVPELPVAEHGYVTRFKLISQCVQAFWNQWRNVYLQSFLKRTKWQSPVPYVLKESDIVLVKNLSTSPTIWPLGKVVSLLPDKAGVLRVVRVLCNGTILVRPVNALVPLVIQDNNV